jgi:RsmE family RNA methyltransferase
VLRLGDGAACSYTDGAGNIGSGTLAGGALDRGAERHIDPPPAFDVVVAAPANKDRTRWLVEKCAELAVSRVRWLRSEYGRGRPPNPAKAQMWAQMALEQSRGAHLTSVATELEGFGDIGMPFVVADRDGMAPSELDLSPGAALAVVIGPEGGWAPEEVPADARIVSFSRRVLRTETAAVVAAALLKADLPDR